MWAQTAATLTEGLAPTVLGRWQHKGRGPEITQKDTQRRCLGSATKEDLTGVTETKSIRVHTIRPITIPVMPVSNHHSSSPKKDGGQRPVIYLKYFQEGGPSHSQRSPKERQLYGKDGPERCFLHSSNSSPIPTSSLQDEREDLPVQLSPFWLVHSTNSIQASHGDAEITEHTFTLPLRYVDLKQVQSAELPGSGLVVSPGLIGGNST